MATRHSRIANLARGLAEAFVAGPWQSDGLVARATQILDDHPSWLEPLASRLATAFQDGPPPSVARLVAWMLDDASFREATAPATLGFLWRPAPAPPMRPAPGAPARWRVPELRTPGELARFLGLDPPQLDWLADRRGVAARAPAGPLRQYDYQWRLKPSGSARLVEAPRPRLKRAQRRVLDGILAEIPPHEAAHGFRPGRSILTFAAPHVGRPVVLKLDLRDFFATIPGARITALFLTAGYPEPVARLLAGLCTSQAPASVFLGPACPLGGIEATWARRLYGARHLPQGAPTSPSLANLAAYRLDARLSALAGAAGATYTRYADDLAFSGPDAFARSCRRFTLHVAAVALEEGFVINYRKTRHMRSSTCQRLAGVVVNDRPNVPRVDFDRLKATLHNCLSQGPASQDRSGHPDFRAHLLGRIAHVAHLNPDRGRKLQALFDRIDW